MWYNVHLCDINETIEIALYFALKWKIESSPGSSDCLNFWKFSFALLRFRLAINKLERKYQQSLDLLGKIKIVLFTNNIIILNGVGKLTKVPTCVWWKHQVSRLDNRDHELTSFFCRMPIRIILNNDVFLLDLSDYIFLAMFDATGFDV